MAEQTGRSLKLSNKELENANTVLSKFGSKSDLAADLQMSRTTINKFFKGEPVQRKQFHLICKKLKLNWQPEPTKKIQNSDLEVDTLVQAIREQVKPLIRERCGTMRVLDMEQPIALTGEQGLYTNVNILEKLTGRRRLTEAELLQGCDPEDFDRFGLSRVTEKRVSGLEAVQRYSKLMVLGKPGAGKTTFLKYLAMQCIEGHFLQNLVPVFITLKDFAETEGHPKLVTYYDQIAPIQEVLRQGRALVLLDGLDEVREEDTKRIVRQIREFSEPPFHSNKFVITCRIAAKEYTFARFSEVEVADFSKEQIDTFVNNWFYAKNNLTKAKHFLQKLNENQPIQELATNPLLLTLLCLIFGENIDFSMNRSELYKESLDVLLRKWDGKRSIERDQVYRKLSLQRKEDLLSQIALITFKEKKYFFKQNFVENCIVDFICNLPDVEASTEAWKLNSEIILKSIEAQHGLMVERAKGVYSFAHLTFHEYFASREIVANSAYEELVEYITKKRWREIFLLTAGMMRKADTLINLMKQIIDGLVTQEKEIQIFLAWTAQKSQSQNSFYKLAALRAFYFDYELAPQVQVETIFPGLSHVIDSLFMSDDDKIINPSHLKLNDPDEFEALRELILDLHLENSLQYSLNLKDYGVDQLEILLANAIDCADKLNIEQPLRQLYEKLPYEALIYDSFCDNEINDWYMNYWESNSQIWIDQLRSIMVEYRNIGHIWRFSSRQKELLQKYYDANKLLIDCLNGDCYVSRELRQEIEETLLLPIAEINLRKALA